MNFPVAPSELATRWLRKYFSDPEAIILTLLLIVGFTIIIFFGNTLAPVIASVIIAYLLETPISAMVKKGVKRSIALYLVYLPFLILLAFLFFGLTPTLAAQGTHLIQELPKMISRGQELLLQLPDLYPQLINETQINHLIGSITQSLTSMGKNLLSISIASVSTLFSFLIFLVLVPVLVFFMLKDKNHLIATIERFMPKERQLSIRVWKELDGQIGNYIRGKFAEICIIGISSYIVFGLLGLKYTVLLAFAVGLSVIIPYIGATVVTFPVAIVGFFQWGWHVDFAWLMGAYMIIQILDGNVIVPWLFSEAVNLHPIAIITAILIFGGFWGFWGVFFAIPLATLVKAVISSWPKNLAANET